ncbi:DUF397 domain-containing protein [Streptomyces iconiensis]|uniref:DUF397 domain-containing protein n=1 Tax=Streptomyces iconiensis TaxID=1384038 RepID=A0ABT6ZNT6_9ACTN|nr:DUF397 domain-containing protein [Streptomyces iconiensis]MDJ1130720.1 DUF397 domain-containing protein [Streptomyces iconiensis]
MTTETLRWFKSSYSGNGGSCIEWAPAQATATGEIPVRDSKSTDGPVLTFRTDAFAAFIGGVRNGSI